MAYRKSILALPLAAAFLGGCLSDPEHYSRPDTGLASAASIASTATGGSPQTYANVVWTSKTTSSLKAGKISLGANQIWIVATGTGSSGSAKTNGVFTYSGSGTGWNPYAAAKSTAAKTCFTVDTYTSNPSAYYISAVDGKVYEVKSNSETALAYPGFSRIAAGTDLNASIIKDLYAIRSSNNNLCRRAGGSSSTVFNDVGAGFKAKEVSENADGVVWILDQSDHPCYKSGNTWNCQAITGTKIVASKGTQPSAWLLSTEHMGTDGDFVIYHFEGSTWYRSPGGAKEIAVDGSGNPWIVKGNGEVFQGSWSFFTDPFVHTSWQGGSVLGKSATEIAVGPDNSVWICGTDAQAGGSHTFSKWTGTLSNPSWQSSNGTGLGLDVGVNGKLWVIGSDKKIYSSDDGSNWGGTGSTTMQDVGAGAAGFTWAVGTDPFDSEGNYGLYYYDNGVWTRNTKIGAVRVDVGRTGHPWIINAIGDVYEDMSGIGTDWQQRFGPRASDITVGGLSTTSIAYLLSKVKIPGTEDYGIYYWFNNHWVLEDGGGVRISLGNDTRAWLVNSTHDVWREVAP